MDFVLSMVGYMTRHFLHACQFPHMMKKRLHTDLDMPAHSTNRASWLRAESEGRAATVGTWLYHYLVGDVSLFPSMPEDGDSHSTKLPGLL